MSADLPALRLDPLRATVKRELGTALVRAALGAAWTARNPRESFAAAPDSAPVDRLYYRAADGWESPVWRLPRSLEGRGEPVLLMSSLGFGRLAFDFSEETSLARRLQAEGFDVYLGGYRGCPGSAPAEGARGFDFDDIVAFDIPAMLDKVREASGTNRVLWVGHAFGGQLLYGHLARGGGGLAAAISLCAAVRFEAPRTEARLASLAAQLIPEGLNLPVRALHTLLSPASRPGEGGLAGNGVDGPVLRGLMVHGSENVNAGLLRQVGTWLKAGVLCDRDDQIDYLAALRGQQLPLLVVAGEGDSLCHPHQAQPVVEAWSPGQAHWWKLGPEWGHLDPLVGRDAGERVHEELVRFLDRHRQECWRPGWP